MGLHRGHVTRNGQVCTGRETRHKDREDASSRMFPPIVGAHARRRVYCLVPTIRYVMRRAAQSVALIAVSLIAGCRGSEPSTAEKKAIASQIEAEVRAADDLKNPDVEKSLERLYTDTARTISAS